MRTGLFVAFGGGLVVAALLGASRVGPADTCVDPEGVDASLRRLSVEQLEARVRGGGLLSPQSASGYLDSLRRSARALSPGERDCTHRAMLLQLVTDHDQRAQMRHALWHQHRSSDELRALYRTEPLLGNPPPERRAARLLWVEKQVLPAMNIVTDEDREYWRREYYGQLLSCDATPATLVKIGADRPHDCVNF